MLKKNNIYNYYIIMTCGYCKAKEEIRYIFRKYDFYDKGIDKALGYLKCECEDEDSSDSDNDSNNLNDSEYFECELILSYSINYLKMKKALEEYFDDNNIDYWYHNDYNSMYKYEFKTTQNHIDLIDDLLDEIDS